MSNLDKNETTRFSYSTVVADLPKVKGYKVIERIGEGAHAFVYLGINENTRRKVAIKVLRPAYHQDKDLLRRFGRELKVVSSLSHPYIIRIFDAGKTGKHCIVMEHLEYSLKNLLKEKHGKFPKREALKIVRRLAQALEYAHGKGVIHRDIKPANILFHKNGQPVLADFGLVKDLNSHSDVTKPFTLLGTPHYMSPEQCGAETVDHLSDIYSLGIVLFEMLSGRLPYIGNNHGELIKQHTDRSIPIPDLPLHARDCQPLINRMMAKDKEERINAHQVRKMIEYLLSGKSLIQKWWQGRQFISYLIIGLAIAIFIIMIITLFVI